LTKAASRRRATVERPPPFFHGHPVNPQDKQRIDSSQDAQQDLKARAILTRALKTSRIERIPPTSFFRCHTAMRSIRASNAASDGSSAMTVSQETSHGSLPIVQGRNSRATTLARALSTPD
jgi:hypothetical protein